jgi:lactate dehydrogenase-like 2-hydroxyacid dehydrogenase
MERPTRPRVFVTRQLPGDALAWLAAQVSLRVWEGQLPPPREVLLTEAQEVDGLITLLTDRVDEPLLDGTHRLLAPHIASASHATRGRMASRAVDNLLAALEGRKPPHCVNPELFT